MCLIWGLGLYCFGIVFGCQLDYSPVIGSQQYQTEISSTLEIFLELKSDQGFFEEVILLCSLQVAH